MFTCAPRSPGGPVLEQEDSFSSPLGCWLRLHLLHSDSPRPWNLGAFRLCKLKALRGWACSIPIHFLIICAAGGTGGQRRGPPILDVGSRGCALLMVVLRPHQVCRHRFQDDVSAV